MLTDGFIDDSFLPLLAVEAGDMNYEPYIQELTTVHAGQSFPLLERVEHGYLIHNYLEYNYSHEQIEERAKSHVEISQKGGRASAMVRWGHLKGNRLVTERLPELSPVSNRTVTEAVTELSPKRNHIEHITYNIEKNQDAFSSKKAPAVNLEPNLESVKKKTRDPRNDTSQIQAWHQATGLYPSKDLWDFVIENLEANPDIEKLKTTIVGWKARGFNPRNVDGILNWYKTGIPEKNGKGASYGKTRVDRGPVVGQTFDDYYGKDGSKVGYY